MRSGLPLIVGLLVLACSNGSDEATGLGFPATLGEGLPRHSVDRLPVAELGPEAKLTLFALEDGRTFGQVTTLRQDVEVFRAALEEATEASTPVGRAVLVGEIQAWPPTFSVVISDDVADRFVLSREVKEDDLLVLSDALFAEPPEIPSTWTELATGDVSVVLFGSLPSSVDGCSAAFGEDLDVPPRVHVALWRDGDILPVLSWWFGDAADEVSIGDESGLHIRHQEGVVPVDLAAWLFEGTSTVAVLLADGLETDGPSLAARLASSIREAQGPCVR